MVIVVNKSHNFFGDHADKGYRSFKPCNHVAEATGIRNSVKKHAQSSLSTGSVSGFIV